MDRIRQDRMEGCREERTGWRAAVETGKDRKEGCSRDRTGQDGRLPKGQERT